MNNMHAHLERWLSYCRTKILDIVGAACWLIVILLVLLGVVQFIEPVGGWMRTGAWNPTPIFDELKGLFPSNFTQWFIEPRDWFGVWEIVHSVLSLSAWWINLIVAGIFSCLALAAVNASAMLSRRHKPGEGESKKLLEDCSGAELLRKISQEQKE